MVPVTEFLRGYLVPADAGLADDPGLKASRWSTGGALSVFETTIAGGPPLHVHDREDECFYVLGGELSVRCGEEDFSEINSASTDDERYQIGERFGIRVVTG